MAIYLMQGSCSILFISEMLLPNIFRAFLGDL